MYSVSQPIHGGPPPIYYEMLKENIDGLKAYTTMSQRSVANQDQVLEQIKLLVEEDGGELLFSVQTGRDIQTMFKGINSVIEVTNGVEHFSLGIYADRQDRAQEMLKVFTSGLKFFDEEVEDGTVPVKFWRNGRFGPDYHENMIQCPTFEEIRENYPQRIREQLAQLTMQDDPWSSGRVILWSGDPGTGKTFAVRALAENLRRRFNASIEVVLDSESLFNDMDYLYNVVLSETVEEGSNKRLVIIEDNEVFFSENCRKNSGFGRLLNIADGLVGQGLETIFLFTTNFHEQVDSALTREGRVLSQSHFSALTATEANFWLKNKNVVASVKEETTIADLYKMSRK